MMDFILSKVAMAVSALMVAGIIGGMFAGGSFLKPGGELENMVNGFSSVVDRLAVSRAEGTMLWTVPFTSDGRPIVLSLDGRLVRAESDTERAVLEPAIKVRTWGYDGCGINASQLADLDKDCPVLEVRSGHSISLESRLVILDNQGTMMVFADKAP